MLRRLFHVALALGLLATVAGPAHAGQVSTCMSVEAPAAERDALTRLVRSEIDRHPTHRASDEPCEAHLRVELLTVQGDRFLTGRVGGEVPQRVAVSGKDGRALEQAMDELLRIVLGNDPVVLHAPGGESFFGTHVLELKDTGRNTIDVAAIETANLVAGIPSFLPGVLLGFTREVSRWQIGVETQFAQQLSPYPGRLNLSTTGRLDIAGSIFFSQDADASGFAGVSLGLSYQRFNGPRGAGLGRGDGEYTAVGPGVGLRGGVELFRTTSTRADLLVEAFLPVFVASDAETEIVKSWVPTLTLAAGARF